jgi:hypothetical protein
MSKVNDVLTEQHAGLSGGHLSFNTKLIKARQKYYWLQARNDVEKWCRQYHTCAASCRPRTRNRGQMHQYNFGVLFGMVAFDVAGPFPWSDQENWCLLIALEYFRKWQKAYAIPKSRDFDSGRSASSSAASKYCRCYIVTRAVTWSLV